MSAVKSIGVLTLLSTIVLSGAVLPVSAATPPNRFSGDVTLNDTDAPIGTTIEASIGGEPRGSIVVKSPGKYEYLPVNGSASDDGMTVTFTVGGLHADQTATWIAMIEYVQMLDLTAGAASTGDTTSPDITITAPASDASFTTATITVSGTASDNEDVRKVQVKVGSGNWIDATGTTSWSTSVTLDPGSYTIYARANDTSGNSGEVQVDNVSYVVGGSEDTTPPTVSIDSPSDGDAFTTATITVSGTASDNEDVRKVQVKVGPSGNWMDAEGTTDWSAIVTLGLGKNTIYARANDTSGNSGEVYVDNVNYSVGGSGDTTPPTVSITAPASDASFTTATITVSGTASDNEDVRKVQVKVGSGNWIDATGTTSWSTTVTLDLGPNTIYARANDTSGNSGEVQVDNVSYVVEGSGDTTPPTVSIDSPLGGDAFTTTTITVRGNASDNEGISGVQVKVGSGDWMDATGTTAWNKTVTISHGMHLIKVIAIDNSGNPSETASITVACNPPSSDGSSSSPGGSVIAPRATPTGTDAQPVSGTITSVTSTSTITETNTPVTTLTKKLATKPETKGLPGFEAMFAIAGLLAVAYMLIRRQSK